MVQAWERSLDRGASDRKVGLLPLRDLKFVLAQDVVLAVSGQSV